MASQYAVYELKGKSALAAQELKAFIAKYAAAQGIVNPPREEILAALQKSNPALLTAIGLDNPVTQIWSGPDSAPRAYHAWPEIFSASYTKSPYYMFCPIDHQGNNFVPEDATSLNGLERENVIQRLTASGRLSSAPILRLALAGVPLPADYDPARAVRQALRLPTDERLTIQVFKAGGESLAAIHDFHAREKARQALRDKLTEYIESLMPKTVDLPGRPGVAATASVYLRGVPGDQEVWVNLREKGAGSILPLASGRGYKAIEEQGGYGSYRLLPDPDSGAGRAFEKMLFSRALLEPSLDDYPALFCTPSVRNPGFNGNFTHTAAAGNGKTPVLHTFGNDYYLVFSRERNKPLPADGPRDAIPVSPATFLWLDQDRNDRARNVMPPPAEGDVARQLRFLAKLDNRDPGPAPPGPA